MDIDFVPNKQVYTAALEFLRNRDAETEKKVYMSYRCLLEISTIGIIFNLINLFEELRRKIVS